MAMQPSRYEELKLLADPANFQVLLINSTPPRFQTLAARLQQDGYDVREATGPDLSEFPFSLGDFTSKFAHATKKGDVRKEEETLDNIIRRHEDLVVPLAVSPPDLVFINYQDPRQEELTLFVVQSLIAGIEKGSATMKNQPVYQQKPAPVYGISRNTEASAMPLARIAHATKVFFHQYHTFLEELLDHTGFEEAALQLHTIADHLTHLVKRNQSSGDPSVLARIMSTCYSNIQDNRQQDQPSATPANPTPERNYEQIIKEARFRLSASYHLLFRDSIADDITHAQSNLPKTIPTPKALPTTAKPAAAKINPADSSTKPYGPARRITYSDPYPGNIVAVVIEQPTPSEPNYHLFIHSKDDFEPDRSPSSKGMFVFNDLSKRELDDHLLKLQIGYLIQYEMGSRHLDNPHKAAWNMAALGFRNYTYAQRHQITQESMKRKASPVLKN